MVIAVLSGFFLIACNHPTTKVAPQKHLVEIKEMRFQPGDITVHAGDTIEWINNDMVDHDVTEETNKEWSSGKLAPGKSWNFVVTKPASYYCSIHVVMKGKIEVE
jgi:plastocyanin